jgi:hypothetical protein
LFPQCLPGDIQTSTEITDFDITNKGNTGSGSVYLPILEPNGSTPLGFTVNGLTPDQGVSFTSGTPNVAAT